MGPPRFQARERSWIEDLEIFDTSRSVHVSVMLVGDFIVVGWGEMLLLVEEKGYVCMYVCMYVCLFAAGHALSLSTDQDGSERPLLL